jgi:hypothetical protein
MAVERTDQLAFGARHLLTPVFFPSISSVKTALPPSAYLALLHSLRELTPQFLVSAFDLSQGGDTIAQSLAAAAAGGATILMDSGNYESYWKDEQESWRQASFHDALRRFPFTFAFGFDEQSPPDDTDAHVELVINQWKEDQAIAGERLIVPIVHGTPENLATLCGRIARETAVPMIAVAERRLGDGIMHRTRCVLALRKALDDTARYVGLHLLGTGNPISIALYSYAGADSFDGLEWCQTVVDHETAQLFHLSQADFFRQQTAWGDSEVSFHARTLAHNLAFYASWMQRLRRALWSGRFQSFCKFNFPGRVYYQCAEALGWEIGR